MNEPSAIQGDYVDLRFIKGRKVCQVVIEIPIEAGEAFVKAFGTPNPSTGVPVALARLHPNATAEKPKGGKLCQRAGILCNEGSFKQFMAEGHSDLMEEMTVTEIVRWYCGVESRANLDHDPEAARKFLDLEASYKAWLAVS